MTAQNVADTVTGPKQSIDRHARVQHLRDRGDAGRPIPTLLTVGGAPSSRALLRFDLPDRLEDSADHRARHARADAVAPDRSGSRTDPSLLVAKSVLADLGRQIAGGGRRTTPSSSVTDTLVPGASDTVRLDVTNIVRLWQSSTTERPEAIFLSLLPEAATFMRAEFGSSRRPDIGSPRLRVTYMLAFPFENP